MFKRIAEIIRTCSPWPGYVLLSLVVLGPLVLPGYILNLDMVFTPNIPVPHSSSNTFPFFWFIHLASEIFSVPVVEKMILLVLMTMAGVGAHKMMANIQTEIGNQTQKRNNNSPRLNIVKSVNHDAKVDKSLHWGAAFAGVLYVVNPFTYVHLMAGQYLVLLGYALLPWFVMALWRFIKNPCLRHTCTASLWAILIGVASIHMVFFVVLLSACMLFFAIASRKLRQNWQGLLKYGVLGIIIFLLAGSHWLAPLISGSSSESQVIASFSSVDTQVFRTDGGIMGIPWNVFALSGFWGDRQDRYALIWEHVRFWPVVIAILVAFVVIGAVLCWRRRDWLGISLGLAGLIAAMLALGDVWQPVAPINTWIGSHVPFFNGYREPQKFVALLVLAYAYLGGVFVQWLRGKVWVPCFGIIPLVILPLLTAPVMLWGAAGQLKNQEYPADWYQLNQYLNQRHSTKSLFLPWHQYMKYSFTHNRVIANPAGQFFDTPMDIGDNSELTKGEHSSNKTKFILEQVHAAARRGEDISGLLKSNGYQYVVLSKSADYENYLWLDNHPGISRLKFGPTLNVYEVTGE